MTDDSVRAADVVLVGLGAAGGIAAQVLTEAGVEVVALEAGPRRNAADVVLDEVRNDVRNWMARPKAMLEVPTWRASAAEVAGPPSWPMMMMNGVGGTTVHYDGMSLRFQPWTFESRSRVVERYGRAAIPANSTVADWPVAYEDLEPFYDAVEYAIGVSGVAGNVCGSLDQRGNYFEAPRRRGYPMPPLRRTGWSDLMQASARQLGWHPFPCPAAINSEPYNGHQECTYCGFCQNNGCYRDAKGTTAGNVIPRAEATGRLTVETGARVVRIEVDAEGLANGVRYVKDGREHFQPAAVVLLGAYTYENTRLLLLSTSRAFPAGLSNNHSQVGMHFTAHITPFAYGLFPDRKLNIFNGTMAQATCVDDWNADNFDHGEAGFIGGGMMTSVGEAKPIGLASTASPPWIPRWGSTWKRWLADHAGSVSGAGAQFDGLSYEENRLDLDPSVRDPWGAPVVRVTHRLYDNEKRGCAFMAERLKRWLLEAGASAVWDLDPLIVDGRHAYGGTRMGDSRDTSVVDRYGFSHEVPNLGVIGASTFPTASGHNPTLTLQALSWRTAVHLVDQWRSIASRHNTPRGD